MTKIAIFPIPDCVNFPGSVMPLHVFEPRYRDMVNYCLEHDVLLAVCHTQKVVKEVESKPNLDEALCSNQSTYKPYPVFSAGRCELLKTTDDGRMVLNVHMQHRYQLLNEVQSLPFIIAECEQVKDEAIKPETQVKAEQTQEKILMRLLALTHAHLEIQTLLKSDEWQLKSPEAFSFDVLGIMQFSPDDMQQLLEMRRPQQRLDEILVLMNNN
jgi:Lon protease-like protein|tara:strand:- start:372 stop:1010 length:639 start_codon:yes stop_codon:yes gene_type:complete